MSELSTIVEKTANALLEEEKKTSTNDGGGENKTETEGSEPAAEPNTENKTENKDEPKTESLFGLSAEEQKQAAELFAGLKDPNKQKQIISAMAQLAGLTPQSTKAEKEEIKEEVLDSAGVLAKHLGKDFDFLAPKLSAAFDELLEKKLKDSLDPVNTHIRTTEEQRIINETNTAFKMVETKYYGGKGIPNDVQEEMKRCMDVFKPNGTISANDYIMDVYNMARGRMGLTSRPSTEGRTERNRTDAASRLASSPGAKDQKNGTSVPNDNRSLKQIVADAAEKANKENH